MQIGKLREGKIDGSNIKITIILPYFNEELGIELLENTKRELFANNVKKENLKIIRVAGALEIPLTAKLAIKNNGSEAIIALGVVIKGRTDHYDLVVNTTYNGLMQVQIETETPIIFGVLTCQNPEQAIQRVRADKLNKGKEYAKAALMQVTINKKL